MPVRAPNPPSFFPQDRRYYKQQEITLWRKGPAKRTPMAAEADMIKKL